jgi:lipopolysaccharide biosynthesis glycosyltransferase
LMSQLHFLKSHEVESDVVLLDSDILINDNLESLFEQEFDVALTIRDEQEMPINGGIIYISQKNLAAAINFFQKLYFLYTEKYQEKSQWWGDQYALADAIGHQANSNIKPGNIEVDGVKILLLPCEIYNFSPNYESDLDLCELKEQKILHFKGPRKQYMNMYWENYLDIQESPDWQQKSAILQQQILALQADRLNLKATIKNCQAEKVELQRQMKGKVKALRQEVDLLQGEKSKLQKYIQELINQITEMQKSKFWQLREQYFKFKQIFSKSE